MLYLALITAQQFIAEVLSSEVKTACSAIKYTFDFQQLSEAYN